MNINNFTQFLNIRIQSLKQNELLQEVKKGVIITPNVDHLVKLQKDEEFYNVYQQAEWIVCDSKILYFLSKLLKIHYLKLFLDPASLQHFMNIIKIILTAKYSY